MIKFGIWNLEQLQSGKVRGLWNDDKCVAADLYADVMDQDKYSDLQESVLMPMQDARGAYKRTYEKRFESFDEQVESILSSELEQLDEPHILDLGVSDGRTAFDFYMRISKYLSDSHEYFATDYSPYITVIKNGGVRVVIDGQDNFVQIVSPPFVLNSKYSKNIILYPLNFLALMAFKAFVVPSVLKKYKAGQLEGREISLFNRKVQDLANENGAFQLSQHNVLDPVPFGKSFDVIRGMNLFNASYFSAEEFKKALGHLDSCLKEGGFLVVGSNHDANTEVDGNVYQKTAEGYKEIYKSGAGILVDGFSDYLQAI